MSQTLVIGLMVGFLAGWFACKANEMWKIWTWYKNRV